MHLAVGGVRVIIAEVRPEAVDESESDGELHDDQSDDRQDQKSVVDKDKDVADKSSTAELLRSLIVSTVVV